MALTPIPNAEEAHPMTITTVAGAEVRKGDTIHRAEGTFKVASVEVPEPPAVVVKAHCYGIDGPIYFGTKSKQTITVR